MVKKILIDARMYGLENAGIGRYIINLIEELKNLGTEEQFIVLLRKKYFEELNFPENWKKVLAEFRHYSLIEQISLPGIISKEKPDLVHFPHFNVPIFWGGNFVVTIHDMTMHKQGTSASTLPLPFYYLKRFPYKLVFADAVTRSKGIIVPSQAVKDELVKHYKISGDKIAVTYEGVKIDFLKARGGAGELEVMSNYGLANKSYFFYVGNAYPHKNLSKAIEAISLLNKENVGKVLFVMAGSRDIFIDRLEKEIDKLKAGEFVKILGYVSDNDLAFLYKNAKAFVYPSLAEGFGLQGLEAMAARILVLASDIPVFKEIYQDNALYFDPNDPHSILEAMKKVVKNNHVEREERISKAREFIKRYSWTKMAEGTLRVYREVLNRT